MSSDEVKEKPKNEESKEDVKESEGVDRLDVKNALVLIIGISTYTLNGSTADDPERDTSVDLPGVLKDISAYREVFEKDYDYTVYGKKDSKWYGKHHWKRKDIKQYIQQGAAQAISEDETKLVHDGLIIVISGHGDEGVIYSSEGLEVEITTLHEYVNAKETGLGILAAKLPTLFVVDACRGPVETGAVSRSVKETKDRFQHQDDLLCTFFGNSPRIMVEETTAGGGLFSACLIDTLKSNAKGKKDLTLSEIAIKAKRKLKEESGGGQLLFVEGDPEMHVVVLKENN